MVNLLSELYTMYDEEDGYNRNRKIPYTLGIYFIYNNEKIIYIGKTNNLRTRLAGHRTNFFYKPTIKQLNRK